MSRLIADIIVKIGYCIRVGRLKPRHQTDVGTYLEVVVQCCIVGVAPLSEVKKERDNLTGIAGKILKLLQLLTNHKYWLLLQLKGATHKRCVQYLLSSEKRVLSREPFIST